MKKLLLILTKNTTMKRLLLILLCLPMIGFGQLTYVPDANFEQALIDLGYDTGVPDGTVPTANINSVTSLYVNFKNIVDLTGIEDFTALTILYCGNNILTILDVSTNTALTGLDCGYNQLTSLDVSANTALTGLGCQDNQLTTLDLRNNNNNLITCDVGCDIYCFNNPGLTCINVDDSIYSTNYWSTINTSATYGNIDAQHYFSNNCSGTTNIQEQTTNKELLKITDLLGRETKQTNQPLFYIYDDGTVEKRIVIE